MLSCFFAFVLILLSSLSLSCVYLDFVLHCLVLSCLADVFMLPYLVLSYLFDIAEFDNANVVYPDVFYWHLCICLCLILTYVVDIAQFDNVNAIYADFFNGLPLPARVTVEVSSQVPIR